MWNGQVKPCRRARGDHIPLLVGEVLPEGHQLWVSQLPCLHGVMWEHHRSWLLVEVVISDTSGPSLPAPALALSSCLSLHLVSPYLTSTHFPSSILCHLPFPGTGWDSLHCLADRGHPQAQVMYIASLQASAQAQSAAPLGHITWSWGRKAGGFPSYHTHSLYTEHMGNFLLSLQGYLLEMKKLKRKSITTGSSFSSPPMCSNLCTIILFNKLLMVKRNWEPLHRAKADTEEESVIES